MRCFQVKRWQAGDDDVPNADSKQGSKEDTQDDEDEHPGGGLTFSSQGLPDGRLSGFANLLGIDDTHPFSRASLLFW
jgi:hypothetical protein